MASQPASANTFTNIGAAGTVVLTNRGANLYNIVLPGTFVGSLEFYDSASAAGTAAGNLIYNIGLPLVNQYKTIELNFRTKNGLTYVATGTPTATIGWD